MGEHEIEGFNLEDLKHDLNEITESNDSVDWTYGSAEECVDALTQAVEDGCDLTIQGVDFIREDSISDILDENRRLRYRLKNANRAVGKQGQTIHLLRAELAEVRQLNSRADRGDLRRMDRESRRLKTLLDSAREEIAALHEKLSAQESSQESDKPLDLDQIYDGFAEEGE